MHKLEPGQSVMLSPFGSIGSERALFCSPSIVGMLTSCLELQYHVVLSFSPHFFFYISLLPLNFYICMYQIQHQSCQQNNLACVSLLASGKPLNYNLFEGFIFTWLPHVD